MYELHVSLGNYVLLFSGLSYVIVTSCTENKVRKKTHTNNEGQQMS